MKYFLQVFTVCYLVGCAYIPSLPIYRQSPQRPESFNSVYRAVGYNGLHEELVEKRGDYDLKLVTIETEFGRIEIDYYQRRERSDDLILVFPILGGKYWFEKYFADYFAKAGFDAAIVRRNGDFKDPKNFMRIESVLREGLSRDRSALDMFSKEYGKRRFASFGLSRGAINAALLAGVDPRLEFNILVLGGTNIAKIIKTSNQPGLGRFRRKVMELHKLSEEQYYQQLENSVETDPQAVAKYVDRDKTLMMLALFDRTVPFSSGMRLRRQLGYPDTIFLTADHYTSLLYTQFLKLLLPSREICLFPFDYVETEAVAFLRKKMRGEGMRIRELPFALAKAPFGVISTLQCAAKSECRNRPRAARPMSIAQHRVRVGR